VALSILRVLGEYPTYILAKVKGPFWVRPDVPVTMRRRVLRTTIEATGAPPVGESACAIDYYFAKLIPAKAEVVFTTVGERGIGEMAIYDCKQNARIGPSAGMGKVLFRRATDNIHVLTESCRSLHLYFYWSIEDLLAGSLSFYIEDPKASLRDRFRLGLL